MKTARILWLISLLAHCVVVIGFWILGSGHLFLEGSAGTAIALGRLAGLMTAQAVLIQFLLIGRLPLLERVLGLDRLSRIHHLSGVTIPYLLILHPLLLTFGYVRISNDTVLAQFALFLSEYDFVLGALVAASLLLLVGAVSVLIVRSRLRYELWYFMHLVVYLAVFLSFWHQPANGGDIIASRVFYWYWISLYTIVLVIHITYRFLRPIVLFVRHRFAVEKVVRETPTVVSIYITGRSMTRFRVRPGQFMIFRFFARGLWWQAHPFSLSTVPDGRQIRISIKAVGDFTRLLPERVRVGTKVMIDGPYGIFTHSPRVGSKVLMIAGGIGITPIRSLAEELLVLGKNVILLYANRSVSDIAFRTELEHLTRTYGLMLVHTLSNEPAFKGEKGYLDEEKLRRLVPDAASREVFLCGPPPMMEKIIITLRELGVTYPHLHFEKFSL